jgi:hypothetical protein
MPVPHPRGIGVKQLKTDPPSAELLAAPIEAAAIQASKHPRSKPRDCEHVARRKSPRCEASKPQRDRRRAAQLRGVQAKRHAGKRDAASRARRAGAGIQGNNGE